MDNKETSELEERLRLVEGLMFATLGLGVVVLILASAVLVCQLNPEAAETAGSAISLSAMSAGINETVGPPLRKVFEPLDDYLARGYMPWARIVALGFFIGTMVWVFVGLKRQYVNLEAPSKKIWYDLRFWTIVSMLPHLVVYFYF